MQRDGLEQLRQSLARLRGDLDVLHVAGHLLHHDLVLEQLGADAVGVGAVLVHLVDRHDHRDLGGLGVMDRLDRLRHDRVVGRHHQHHDVRHLRATGPHGGEGRMARRVEEGERRAVHVDLIGADMLRDPARLARDDLGLADRVEKRRLAVVDMAHDRDDRRAVDQILGRVVRGGDHLLHVRIRDADDAVAELLDDDLGSICVDDLVLRDHHSALHKGLDHGGDALGHAVGQFGDDDRLGQADVAHHLLLDRVAAALAALPLLLAPHGGERPLPSPLAAGERLVDGQLATATFAALGLAGLVLALAWRIDARARPGIRPEVALARRVGDARIRHDDRGFRLGGAVLLLLPPLILLGALAGELGALLLLALLGLDVGTAAGALVLALALLAGAAFGILGLPRTGELQRPEAAVHFRVAGARLLAALRVDRGGRLRAGLGDRHALALGLHHDVVGAPAGEALLDGAATRTAAQAEGFLAVLIAHAFPISFSAAGLPPSDVLMP